MKKELQNITKKARTCNIEFWNDYSKLLATALFDHLKISAEDGLYNSVFTHIDLCEHLESLALMPTYVEQTELIRSALSHSWNTLVPIIYELCELNQLDVTTLYDGCLIISWK